MNASPDNDRAVSRRMAAPNVRRARWWAPGFLCALLVLALALSGPLAGVAQAANASAYALVEKGNAAYQAGRYDEALKHYNAASVEKPESPQLYFNQGTVHYQQGDYEAATKAFAEAAVRGKEPAFEARARYNQGNCAFREAERQRDSDLNKAIEACRDAIVHYQDALKLDPQLATAAENIEIVRLYVKALLDEQQQQQEEQQQQDDLGKKLKELLERQVATVQENDALAQTLPAQQPAPAPAPAPVEPAPAPGSVDDPLATTEPALGESAVSEANANAPFDAFAQNGPEANASVDGAEATPPDSAQATGATAATAATAASEAPIAALTATQRTLQEDTVAVLDEMRQLEAQMARPSGGAGAPQAGPPAPAPVPEADPMVEKLGTALGHVTESINAQGAALRELGASASAASEPNDLQDTRAALASARGHQQESAVQLAEALKALSDPEQEQQQQQQQNPDDQSQQQDQQDQQDGDGDQQQEQQQEQESGDAGEDGEQKQQDQQEQQEQGSDGQQGDEDENSEQQQSALKPLGESAEDILNEEKENQKRRVPVRVGGVRPVDKDW